MATTSTDDENLDTTAEEWQPVGAHLLEADQ